MKLSQSHELGLEFDKWTLVDLVFFFLISFFYIRLDED